MRRLINSAIASLDGFVEDAHGRFEWAAPGEEAHAFVNELERPVGTYLYGRRMYELAAHAIRAGLVDDTGARPDRAARSSVRETPLPSSRCGRVAARLVLCAFRRPAIASWRGAI